MSYDVPLYFAWKKGFDDYTRGDMKVGSASALPYPLGSQDAVAYFLGCGAARQVRIHSPLTCDRCGARPRGWNALECATCAESLPGCGIQPAVVDVLVSELRGMELQGSV